MRVGISVFAAVALSPCLSLGAFDASDPCAHERYDTVAESLAIGEGQQVYAEISTNQTHLYFYENTDVQFMNQQDAYRKLIIMLEPCRGVSYLFVRKTRRCWPNPYSCIELNAVNSRRGASEDCEWTHFSSDIDGSKDGAPTIFEVPLTSTRYYIAVFGFMQSNAYTLTVMADVGQMPRPGSFGKLQAYQTGELSVELSWDTAKFFPIGPQRVKKYWIYSSLLLDSDSRENTAVFLKPTKIMNTVCGLKNNTGTPYYMLGADEVVDDSKYCNSTKCVLRINNIIQQKRYVFNVVVETTKGYQRAYAGLILSTDWKISTQAADDSTLKVVAAVAGSVLAISITGYIWLLKLYSS